MSIARNIEFSSFLEFRKMDKIHKPSDSEDNMRSNNMIQAKNATWNKLLLSLGTNCGNCFSEVRRWLNFFNLANPSRRTIVLGLTQPLT
jgi:hypothetical protein